MARPAAEFGGGGGVAWSKDPVVFVLGEGKAAKLNLIFFC
jgi:hypothetical protein